MLADTWTIYYVTCLASVCDPLIQPNLILRVGILGTRERKELELKALGFSVTHSLVAS